MIEVLVVYVKKTEVLKRLVADMNHALSANLDWCKSVQAKSPDEAFAMLSNMKNERFIENLKSSKTLGYISDEEQTLIYNIYQILLKQNLEENL